MCSDLKVDRNIKYKLVGFVIKKFILNIIISLGVY